MSDPQFSDKAMSDPPSSDLTSDTPLQIDPSYMDAKTCVFWNVEDYPIPSGSDPVLMGQKIKSALPVENIRGEVSIKAYVDKKNTLSDELRGKYIDAGIAVNPLPEGDAYSRISPLLVDAFVWALENPAPANMIVLSNLGEEGVRDFQFFYSEGFGVLLSDEDTDWLPPPTDWPIEESASFLTSLFGKKRKREDTLTMGSSSRTS